MRRHVPPRFAAALTIAVVALATSGCGGSAGGGDGTTTSVQPVLAVCSDIPYVPFEYLGPDGPTGFDVDLVTEVASRLARRVEIVTTPLDGFGAAFADGSCDIAASALLIPPPGTGEWPFSVPYLELGQSMLVRTADAAALPSFESLAGHRVGVVADSTSADFAAATLPADAATVPFTTVDDAVAALRAGTVDAVVADAPVNGHTASLDDALTVTESRPTTARYGVAVDPADAALLGEVDGALTDMAADGTLARLSTTWFGS